MDSQQAARPGSAGSLQAPGYCSQGILLYMEWWVAGKVHAGVARGPVCWGVWLCFVCECMQGVAVRCREHWSMGYARLGLLSCRSTIHLGLLVGQLVSWFIAPCSLSSTHTLLPPSLTFSTLHREFVIAAVPWQMGFLWQGDMTGHWGSLDASVLARYAFSTSFSFCRALFHR